MRHNDVLLWHSGQSNVEGIRRRRLSPIRNEYGGVVAIEMGVKGQLVTVSSMAEFDHVRTLAGQVAGRMR